MPTIRRRKTERRADAIESRRIQEMLLCGSDFQFLDPELGESLDPPQLRRSWQQLRDKLLAEHAEEKGLFSRPWGWWQYDATELRRWAAEWPMGAVDESWEPWFGCPGTHTDAAKGILGGCDREWFETERDYLLRHPKLLTKEEKELSQ